MADKMKKLTRREGSGVAFTTLTYLEDKDWAMPFAVAKYNGFPYAYAIHDKDGGKVHCQSIIRVPNHKTISAFSKKFHVAPEHVQILSSWRDFCLYLIHADFDSMLEGKNLYPDSIISGSFADEVREVIRNHKEDNQGRSKEDDSQVLKIIEFIESMDYVRTADVVRWCCLNGCYSNLRRSASILNNVIKEHNSNCTQRYQETLFNARIREYENRLERVERLEHGRRIVKEVTGLDRPIDMELLREIQKMA